MRRLLLLIVLLAALPAAAETCTSNGSFNWTSVTAGTWTGCTASADDDFVIASGHTVTITDGSTVSQDDDGTANGVAVESGGALVVDPGGELQTAEGFDNDSDSTTNGLHIESGGTLTMQGHYLDYDSSPGFSATAPSVTAFARVGDVIHCPGDDNVTDPVQDCDGSETDAGLANEMALCWPEATYNVTSDGNPGEQFYDTYVAAIAVGDILTFWDPTSGQDPPRDVNAHYEVTDVQHGAADPFCVYVDVRQGVNDPASDSSADADTMVLAKRDIKAVSISADYEAGERTITVPAATFTDDDDYVGRYLSCPDANARASFWSALIVDTDEDGTGTDTITISSMGLPAAIDGDPTPLTCFLDFGWNRGDPIFVYRPAVYTSSTSGAPDSRLECEGTCTFNAAQLHSFHETVFGDGATITINNSWWYDHGQNGTKGNQRDGLQFAMGTAAANAQIQRLQVTGTGFASGDDVHQIGLGPTTGLTMTDLNIRHTGDDFFVVLGDTTNTLIKDARLSWMSGTGGSASVVDPFGSTSSYTFDGLSCEDCSIPDAGADNVLQCNDTSTCTFLNVAMIGPENDLAAPESGTNSGTINNLYVESGECCASTAPAFSGAGTAENFSLVDMEFDSDSALTTTASDWHMVGGVILNASKAGTNTGLMEMGSSGRTALYEDLAIINPSTTGTGTQEWIFKCGSLTASNVIRNVTLAWTPGSTTGIDRAIWDSGCTVANFTVDGYLCAHLTDDADTGSDGTCLRFGTQTSQNDTQWGDGPCLFDNSLDVNNAAFDDNLPASTVRDVPPGFVDAGGGDFRLRPGGTAYAAECGSRQPGASDMWPLRVLHIDPYKVGTTHKKRGRRMIQ